jgi:hypothetical protein
MGERDIMLYDWEAENLANAIYKFFGNEIPS